MDKVRKSFEIDGFFLGFCGLWFVVHVIDQQNNVAYLILLLILMQNAKKIRRNRLLCRKLQSHQALSVGYPICHQGGLHP